MMRATHLSPFRLFAALLVAVSLVCSAGISGAADAVKKPSPSALFLSVDKSEGLTLEAAASTVFIANPDVADVQVVTPTHVMVFGKKAGETTLIVSGDGGALLAQRTVVVKPNLSDLQAALRALSPDRPIRAEAVPNGLILTGQVSSAALIEEARRLAARYVPAQDGDIINRIKLTANDQIMIRVRFAEVSRDVDKRFGINWETIGNVGGFAFGLATGKDFVTAGARTVARTTVGDATNDALFGLYNNDRYSVNGMLDALAQNGLVTILAEPSLTALSGETASFLAGGEFPIPVPQSADTITIEWKQYGVSLSFTPTIIGENRINLHVRPEVSQLSSAGAVTLNNVEVPALTTRRAETTLELNSGQSFALAGLLNNQQTQSVEKFPFLGDIPVLGPLFRSSRFQNSESELVIVITPYIVKPSTQERLALPTDGFVPPTDKEFFFGLQETGKNPTGRPISGPPRAVKIEEMNLEDAPQPEAAPRASVTTTPSEIKASPETKLFSTAPVSKPQTKKASVPLAPSGPGGFIME